MTPGARVAAAIEILDMMAAGQAAEQALTRWARSSRFAGSKDRAAVRDHVFDVVRTRRSAAALGGGTSGRALMIGALREAGADIETVFDGQGHAPAPLTAEETTVPAMPDDLGTAWNLPDWLLPEFTRSLGETAEATARALQERAPVSLRVNLRKADVAAARADLADEGVMTAPNPLAAAALTITQGARRLRNSRAYRDGWVELQDAASQAVVEALPPGRRVLDYCAGGGGKALAIAMQDAREVFAHDIDPRRMQDLPARAARAGARITQLATDAVASHAPFDLVLCDAPCSGSGSWRRAPDAKWALTGERLNELTALQDSILTTAMTLVAPGGALAYATCSVLTCENEDRIAAFLRRNANWRQSHVRRLDVDSQGDGFFTAHLTRV
ncbi:RsmB/NOP family class I SAM-dependent RNA methyltransferase [Sulfitobacter sabulilitoris]|uniref:RsmB/NOP family class I SAM-dependent RNA methyltransferase n=1 Tax=Sulfitobacter sabulilitoris TaxID=2562655 RepID=A0A5S3PK00_9RHOB|nr:RsmB/NOP family class I SAM-dependent RNA methyltransferase [Sulfitobacter sabulilitoris]TMM54576.1 RsmB/NOP family class I SAM-dependent RNA methyltransferase [Sulfitobacter sabulilitoris]